MPCCVPGTLNVWCRTHVAFFCHLENSITSAIGMANVASRPRRAILTPMTCPLRFSSGPPQASGLIAMSCCRTAVNPLRRRLMFPARPSRNSVFRIAGPVRAVAERPPSRVHRRDLPQAISSPPAARPSSSSTTCREVTSVASIVKSISPDCNPASRALPFGESSVTCTPLPATASTAPNFAGSFGSSWSVRVSIALKYSPRLLPYRQSRRRSQAIARQSHATPRSPQRLPGEWPV